MDTKLRKTLLISSYAPPTIAGAPQMLYNLFRDFPSDSYCIMTSFYNIDNLSAQTTKWLKGKYIFYDNPTFSGFIHEKPQVAQNKILRSFLNELKHLIKRIKLLGLLSGIFIIGSQIIMMIKTGLQTIKKEKIELMIGASDYGPAMISTYFLHKITKIPYYLILFDIYKGNPYPVFPANFLANCFEPKLFKNANKIIVTNEGTKDFYIKRYGKEIENKIIVIHNSIFPDKYLKLQTEYNPKPPYKIIYTGRIYWAQSESIKNLIQAINKIDDLDIEFHIYCSDPKGYLEKIGIKESKKIKILVAPPEKMPEIQSQADILFLPLSWHTKSPDVINTATPGKLSDYLISNRPILIHAPSSTFLVQYAKKYNFATIVDEESTEKLIMAIKKLLTDKKFAQELIQNAKTIFFKNHDANLNSLSFYNLFK